LTSNDTKSPCLPTYFAIYKYRKCSLFVLPGKHANTSINLWGLLYNSSGRMSEAEEIASLKSQLTFYKTQIQTYEKQMQRYDNQIQAYDKQIQAYDKQIQAYQTELQSKNEEIRNLKNQGAKKTNWPRDLPFEPAPYGC
jgi:peptidoglycan hydrolase CwlO-like protein